MPSILPPEIWDQIDRISRIHCCHAESGERCKGFHHQGTRVVYGYEVMNKAVMGALHASRNNGLEDGIEEISRLTPTDGMIRKSDVLETLSHLKWLSD